MIRVVRWRELHAGQRTPQPVALTIGAFDSLHVGHQRLIRAVVDNSYGVPAAVCTFEENPARVLGSRPFVGSILSFKQKVEKLERLGVALVVLIDFSPEISTLSGKDFFGLLTGRFSIRKLVVGYNFQMGHGRDTGVKELVGILSGSDTDLEVVPATLYRQEVVSSSRIRNSILEGRLDDVREMLQDDFRLDLQGLAIERRQGESRVRRSHIDQVLPRIGEYQVRFISDNFECSGTLTVEEQQLRWGSVSAGEESEICFVERL